jgi:hypothetical protein
MASTGTSVNGKGFIVSPEEAAEFIKADPRNKHVLQRYLTSQDINQRVDSAPSRLVINFGDMPEREAKTYQLPFERVRTLVKPARDKLTRQVHEKCFWKHWDRRDELYATLRSLKRALVLGRVSSRHAVTFMEKDCLPFDGVVVFLWDDYAHFGLFQSSLHEIWCDRFRTTLRQDPRYSVSDCFMTFARPHGVRLAACVERIGQIYFDTRKELMLRGQAGLTTIYNRFHDQKETASDMRELRRLHVAMDEAVALAYGWDDIKLDHGFRETPNGLAFTICEASRTELMRRLIEMNHYWYKEEGSRNLADEST